jgi:hypothetical protein
MSYRAWRAMLKRCYNKSYHAYHRYGGRGIEVCARWHSVENFVADMGERPEGMSLERVNNDGHYEPENCRWATTRDQCINKKTTRLLTANGKSMPMCEWARVSGLKAPTICRRLAKGWSEQDAVTLPPVNPAPFRARGYRGRFL